MAGLLDDALDGGAAYGFFPQIKKNRKFNDRESSANMPVQGVLGTTAATGGVISDLLSLFQSPKGNEMMGDVSYEPNINLPYGTQDLSRMLPLQPTTPNERFARGLGEMIPLNPTPALKALGKVGEFAVRGGGEMLNAAMMGENQGLLGKIVPQPKFIYLPTTKSKPNPLVGTRYETEQLPGIVPRKPVNYDEMEGGSIMTYPTDMLSKNTLVTSVSDIPLGKNSFVTPGGLMYMMDENNIARQIGYASNQAAATSQNNRAAQAIKENKDMGGTGRIFMAPHTMPPGGENFSTGPTLGLLSLIATTNPSPQLLEMISNQMRAKTVKGVEGKYKDFVGLNDPAARDQLLTGKGLSAGSAGDLRKIFVEKMANVGAEKGLGFNYPDLQRAMFDPNVMNKSPFLMGDSIYEAFPNLGISAGSHGAYGYDIPGVFFGNTRGAPVSEFMKPLYESILPTQMNKPGSGYKSAPIENLINQIQMPSDIPAGITYADPHQLTRGKLSTAGENISMFMDKAQIERLKKLLGEK